MGNCSRSNRSKKGQVSVTPVTTVVQVGGSSQSTDQQSQSKHTESAVDPVVHTLSKEQEAAMANYLQWSSLKTPPQILPKRVIPVCKFFGKRAQQTEITSLHFKWEEGELIQFKAPPYPFDLLGVFEVDKADEGQAALNYGHIVLATLQHYALGIKRLKDKKSVLRGVVWTAEAFFSSKIRCDDAACTAALVERTRISFLFGHEYYGAVIVRVREGALIAETVWGDHVDSFDRTGNEKFIIICPKMFAVEFCKVGGPFLGNDSEIEHEPQIIKRFEDIFQTSKTLVDTSGEVMVMKIDKKMKVQQANGE